MDEGFEKEQLERLRDRGLLGDPYVEGGREHYPVADEFQGTVERIRSDDEVRTVMHDLLTSIEKNIPLEDRSSEAAQRYLRKLLKKMCKSFPVSLNPFQAKIADGVPNHIEKVGRLRYRSKNPCVWKRMHEGN